VIAAKTMKNHLNLLNRDNKKTTAAERLAISLQEVLGSKSVDNGLVDRVRNIHSLIDDVNDRTVDIKETVNEINNTVN
jgi:hypothetical protein